MNGVEKLKDWERLAGRKASVYGRVLTDVTLATEMQELAEFHQERVVALAQILGIDVKKEKGDKGNEA